MGTKLLAHTPAAAFFNNAFADVWTFRFSISFSVSFFALFLFFSLLFFFKALKVADLENSLVRLASLAELTQRTSSDPRVREWCATRISANTIVDQVLSSRPAVFIE